MLILLWRTLNAQNCIWNSFHENNVHELSLTQLDDLVQNVLNVDSDSGREKSEFVLEIRNQRKFRVECVMAFNNKILKIYMNYFPFYTITFFLLIYRINKFRVNWWPCLYESCHSRNMMELGTRQRELTLDQLIESIPESAHNEKTKIDTVEYWVHDRNNDLRWFGSAIVPESLVNNCFT